MPTPDVSHKLAVLIDADNAQPGVVDALLDEIAKYGVASVKRVYGDWTTPQLKGWKDAANVHGLQPMQQFSYTTGKNATDSALIIDAMDLLYTGTFDGFCLVSSDSDFTGLAKRLRQSGISVYGFGERKTPIALVAACDKFVYLDVLRTPTTEPADQAEPVGRSGVKELRRDAKLMNLMRSGLEAAADDDGWAQLGSIGSHIAKQAPDFDPRNWGYRKLVDLVAAIGLFEVNRESAQVIMVREKKRGR